MPDYDYEEILDTYGQITPFSELSEIEIDNWNWKEELKTWF